MQLDPCAAEPASLGSWRWQGGFGIRLCAELICPPMVDGQFVLPREGLKGLSPNARTRFSSSGKIPRLRAKYFEGRVDFRQFNSS
jgi:hypothetical protein